ncbi:MAG: DUF4419 domain-containing protein [Candidatus Xenobia bacterium]
MSATTFLVADVTPATQPEHTFPVRKLIARWFGPPLGCSESMQPVRHYEPVHTLLHAARLAFLEHRPLVLSPDVIWLTLLHGFATHVNQHAEALRPLLVAHSERLTLRVDATSLIHGREDDRWDEVFSRFSAQLKEHVGRIHEIIVANFSTTGPVERAAYEVALMDAFQACFHYEGMCMCGIPQITLEGTTADWHDLRQRIEMFTHYGLGWWVMTLRPILDQFVLASQGYVNRDFWHDLYQHHNPDNSYGGPYDRMTGWIAALLPYMRQGANPLITGEPIERAASFGYRRPEPEQNPVPPRYPSLGLHYECPVRLRDFGLALSNVPVDWKMGERKTVMRFISGLMAIEQDPTTFALRPRIGWAVVESGARG